MYKGVKALGDMKTIDNYGDSIYELVGKWKAIAKKRMHKIIRTRGKVETRRCAHEE